MSTLSQIIGNVIMGSIVTTGSFCAFGAAVRFGWNSNLTPRAWSRPKAVLKNVLHGPWYGVSWIGWAMRQQYSDLLAGIPGTGTRMDGWSGPTLKTNLDTVILLRFHMMQLKVSRCVFVDVDGRVSAASHALLSFSIGLGSSHRLDDVCFDATLQISEL